MMNNIIAFSAGLLISVALVSLVNVAIAKAAEPDSPPIVAAAEPSPPKPCCDLHLTPEQLDVIGAGLAELPYKTASPVIEALRAQYRDQRPK